MEGMLQALYFTIFAACSVTSGADAGGLTSQHGGLGDSPSG